MGKKPGIKKSPPAKKIVRTGRQIIRDDSLSFRALLRKGTFLGNDSEPGDT